MENIRNKVVVITGASSGLGEATAKLLSSKGAIVVLGARRSEKIKKLETEIIQNGGKALAITTDVTKIKDVQNLVNSAVKTYGKIDEWNQMIDVNIKGVLNGIAAALPFMQKQKFGHFINVSSVAGHKISMGGAVYCATKHVIRALSEGLRQEVKPYNIRTTIVSPSAVNTELPNTITDEETSKNVKDFYAKYAISADSFARIVEFTISQPKDVDINEVLFRPTVQEY